MKKIPTLFVREFKGHDIIHTTSKPESGLEYIVQGAGVPTVKFDGACCAVIGGVFYRRYDAKNGKKIPDGAIRCQEEPDPVTGHMPCWIACDRANPSDKWFFAAFDHTFDFIGKRNVPDGTYEAVGPHFQGNPYQYEKDILLRHGSEVVELKDHSYGSIRRFLENHYIEGLVFWDGGEPVCKIKRSDFGFSWNKKR